MGIICDNDQVNALQLAAIDAGPNSFDFGGKPRKIGRANCSEVVANYCALREGLLQGGLIAMSLIFLTAFLTFSTTDISELGPLPNWSLGQTPTGASSKPQNEVRLDGSRLLWNGDDASESQVRNYLSIVKQLDPQPRTVLSHGAGVPPERVQRVRALVDDALGCEPATCFEVIRPGK